MSCIRADPVDKSHKDSHGFLPKRLDSRRSLPRRVLIGDTWVTVASEYRCLLGRQLGLIMEVRVKGLEPEHLQSESWL